jgi:glycosyltransferase involved in cell wall biosynthesis
VRTVLITTSYPREPGDPAGHFVETEAMELAREGAEVHVIAPGSGGLEPRADVGRGASWAVWRVGGSSLFGFPGALSRARENPLRLLQLGRFLPGVTKRLSALEPIDRVIAHFVAPSAFPLALGCGGELEVVLHGSDVRVVGHLPSLLRTRVFRRLLARGATFRFVAEGLRSELLAALLAPERDSVRDRSRVEPARIAVPRATDADLARCRSILGTGDRPRWVTCARLIRSKRVDIAIREAARRGAELTVIGDGPMRAPLEKLASEIQPRPRFLGQLPRHQTLAFIESADRLIHTSMSEGSPTVIREARALQVPVLATASGDVARWAKTDSGIELLTIESRLNRPPRGRIKR